MLPLRYSSQKPCLMTTRCFRTTRRSGPAAISELSNPASIVASGGDLGLSNSTTTTIHLSAARFCFRKTRDVPINRGALMSDSLAFFRRSRVSHARRALCLSSFVHPLVGPVRNALNPKWHVTYATAEVHPFRSEAPSSLENCQYRIRGAFIATERPGREPVRRA